jgi:Uma2 family endonuclease
MCRVVIQQAENVIVPEWVEDRASFHRWADSEDFPAEGRIDYLHGEVWIDMSEEQLFSHNQVKTEITLVLGAFVKAQRLGRFFQDGARVEHPEADLSAVPDAVFVSTASFQQLRVRTVEGAEGPTRLQGSPDMVLEVVSPSSIKKDKVRLRPLYWQAGIPEYWLVDARKEPLRFDILRREAEGYTPVRKRQGWARSAVFGRSFRLTQSADDLGQPEYTLEMR